MAQCRSVVADGCCEECGVFLSCEECARHGGDIGCGWCGDTQRCVSAASRDEPCVHCDPFLFEGCTLSATRTPSASGSLSGSGTVSLSPTRPSPLSTTTPSPAPSPPSPSPSPSSYDVCYRVRHGAEGVERVVSPVTRFPALHGKVRFGVCGGAAAGDPIPAGSSTCRSCQWSVGGVTNRTFW